MSIASADRSLSSLKRFKTYLRNQIGQEKLSGLVLFFLAFVAILNSAINSNFTMQEHCKVCISIIFIKMNNTWRLKVKTSIFKNSLQIT
jgi:hypothetical protein